MRSLIGSPVLERGVPASRLLESVLTEAPTATVDRRRRGEPVTGEDYRALAERLGVDATALEALAEVESGGRAFGADGRPVLRFEQHVFRRETGGRYDRTHPHLSVRYEVSRRLRRNQTREWRWFEEAYALDPDAAIRAASWGRFQIMGFHHERLGYGGAEELRVAMEAGEQQQLEAFGEFLRTESGMIEALRRLDWAGVARRYNGPGYRDWRYDERLRRAYERLRNRRTEPTPEPAPEPVPVPGPR